MTNDNIKKLANLSFKGNLLDQKKVLRIVKILNRSELRGYLREIKSLENKKTVEIFVPKKTGPKNIMKNIKTMFPDKKIIIREDKTLIAGVRVKANDTVYDFNLKDELNKIVEYISQ